MRTKLVLRSFVDLHNALRAGIMRCLGKVLRTRNVSLIAVRRWSIAGAAIATSFATWDLIAHFKARDLVVLAAFVVGVFWKHHKWPPDTPTQLQISVDRQFLFAVITWVQLNSAVDHISGHNDTGTRWWLSNALVALFWAWAGHAW